jgi:hypothetical protein
MTKYRKNAEECRAQAAKCVSLLDKAQLFKSAEAWLRMAQEAERPRGESSN